MREFTFLLNEPGDGGAASYQVEVRSKCRAYQLAREILARSPGCASIDILEGDVRVCTVSAGEGAAG